MQLRRADVLRGARDLLDADGLDGLTMRKLGAALNVQAGGLYWHFPSKQALLEAVADDLLAGVAETPPAGPWDQRLLTLAHRLRQALLSVRDGARLVAETFVTEPNTSMAGRTGMRILMDAGLPAEQAAWTMFAVGHYVLGHTIEEQSTGADREAKLAAQAEADADLRELAAAIGADPGRRFEFGLALMIDGIRVRVSGRTPADS
ncbi:TetR/AcrR family transcriptional regulator C-terminal domain-containing protein [Paractinoplanes durhamensis]|uniref:TetR family transcriptional regulator n=1 Tax=Paractinoplanes durhamensis TaxID=113563 RepID=A0ABQ3Z023_9ACTN|nr:TetR/AcrR family transcriptional regulator C-terminal domain-containing protein [Actinoplanes durhamensis]GIE03167.1 TetR family transcriptional regulator [Actinoplanes durhamensis]